MICIGSNANKFDEEVKEYSKYRSIGMYLNDDILECLHDTQKPINDFKLLKIMKGNEIRLHKENEQDLCYDFILYEKTLNKKSGIIDIGLSKSIQDECLIFTRFISYFYLSRKHGYNIYRMAIV